MKHGEGQVVEVGVGNKGQVVASAGQVRRSESLESAEVETSSTANLGQRRNADRGDVDEGQVGSRLEVGQANLEIGRVGSESKTAGDVAKSVDIDLGEVTVVVDVHGRDSLELNTAQAGEGSIGDLDIVGPANTLTEVQRLKSRKRDPLDAVNVLKGAELET